MTENPLLRQLSHLSRKEMTRFRDFAHSPYFNKHQGVQALATCLSEMYPDFSQRKCEREVIFQKLFPGKPHNQPELAVIFTYALRLFEQFQRVEQAIEEGFLEDEALTLRHSRLKNSFSPFQKIMAEKVSGGRKSVSLGSTSAGFKTLPTLLPVTSGDLERRFKLLAEQDLAAVSQARYEHHFLEEKQAWLDAWYLSEKLRDACELRQRQRLLRTEFEEGLTQNLSEVIEAAPEKFAPYPTVTAYFHLYKLLSVNDLAQYEKTVEALHGSESSLPVGDVQNIFNHLQNFCISQINRGDRAYLRELFGIYQKQLERGLLMVEGRLPEWHYKNIVTTGLRLGEQGWVRDFLEKYRSLLPPEVAENAWRYNLAAWHHHLGQFDQTLKLLVQVEFTDLRYSLDAKALLLRSYFELEEEEALGALCESFKQFIVRNKSLTDFQKKGYLNLLKYTRRTFRLKVGKGILSRSRWQADLEKLRSEVTEAEAIFNKAWLEEKLTNLN